MVKQAIESFTNGALAKQAPTLLVLALLAAFMQWMHVDSVKTVTESNNRALDKAVDRLVESNRFMHTEQAAILTAVNEALIIIKSKG